MKQTAIMSIDSYKIGHKAQYPDGITKVYSNFTPRSNKHLNIPAKYKDDQIVWVGLQAFLYELNEIWNSTFFNVEWDSVSSELEQYAPFCGPNGVDKSHFKELHELGYLPIEIKSLAEGTVTTIGVPVLTITNTQDKFYWLPNFLETWMSAELWKAPTSATIARAYRKILNHYVEETGASTDFANWQLHDFSVRGMSGISDAAKSGLGHLLFSLGTDNLPAVNLVNQCYDGKSTFIGGSVPATEHSVMCSGGKDTEIETFRRLIKTYPSGVLSIVSDTWDFWKVVTEYASELKNDILARVPDELGLAKVVFRPDSGDPVEIICGKEIKAIPEKYASTIEEAKKYATDYIECLIASETPHGECGEMEATKIFSWCGKFYRATVELDWSRYDKQYYYVDGANCIDFVETELTPEERGAVECLAEIFGTTTNQKGFKTLNQRVGLIYGDSITPERADQILSRLAEKGYAADNIVFGIGSFTYQYNTRDTLGFAMKATCVKINGELTPIFKDPKTDSGTKKSAKGLLSVRLDENDRTILVDNVSESEEHGGLLNRVYLNGYIMNTHSFDSIRSRANK